MFFFNQKKVYIWIRKEKFKDMTKLVLLLLNNKIRFVEWIFFFYLIKPVSHFEDKKNHLNRFHL